MQFARRVFDIPERELNFSRIVSPSLLRTNALLSVRYFTSVRENDGRRLSRNRRFYRVQRTLKQLRHHEGCIVLPGHPSVTRLVLDG